MMYPDGKVKVYIETPDETGGFHDAICWLPVRKTTAVDIIWNMIKLKVISKDDLNDFLDELKQEMERRTGALAK